jgi:hypothetical protein
MDLGFYVIFLSSLSSNGVKVANENPLGSTSEVYADSPVDGAHSDSIGLSCR